MHTWVLTASRTDPAFRDPYLRKVFSDEMKYFMMISDLVKSCSQGSVNKAEEILKGVFWLG